MIRAIVFDLGGVMLNGGITSFLKTSEKILGFKGKHGTEACFDRKLNLGTSSHRAAFERAFGKKLSDEEFIPLMKAWMNNWGMNEEMLALAKSLKKKYKIAILSNSEISFEEKYDAALQKAFHLVVYSHKVRMTKPGKEIFQYALQKLDVKPEECIMVDDAKENEVPCRQLGMHFILFKDREQLGKQLELHGVKVPKAQKKASPPIEIRPNAIMQKGIGNTEPS